MAASVTHHNRSLMTRPNRHRPARLHQRVKEGEQKEARTQHPHEAASLSHPERVNRHGRRGKRSPLVTCSSPPGCCRSRMMAGPRQHIQQAIPRTTAPAPIEACCWSAAQQRRRRDPGVSRPLPIASISAVSEARLRAGSARGTDAPAQCGGLPQSAEPTPTMSTLSPTWCHSKIRPSPEPYTADARTGGCRGSLNGRDLRDGAAPSPARCGRVSWPSPSLGESGCRSMEAPLVGIEAADGLDAAGLVAGADAGGGHVRHPTPGVVQAGSGCRQRRQKARPSGMNP